MNTSDLESTYTERHDKFLTPAADLLQKNLRNYLSDRKRIDRIDVRAKSVTKFLEKAERENNGSPAYSDPLHDIQDQLGARIVTFYKSDVDQIAADIKDYYPRIEEQAVEPSSDQEFGYFGLHFILFLPEDCKPRGATLGEDLPKFFELQIKTLFEHAWSEAHHDLGYKPSRPISSDQRRKIAFTAAQAWGADRIFNELATDLGLDDEG